MPNFLGWRHRAVLRPTLRYSGPATPGAERWPFAAQGERLTGKGFHA